MTAVGPIFGLVLAGGRSRRFGREKAAADLHGRPLIVAVYDVLALACGRVGVNAPDGGFAAAFAQARGLIRLPDAPGDPDGPLSGVLAGLAWAAAEGAALLATAPCDTPFLPRDLVGRLTAGLGEAPAAMARTGQGLHPLCAIWRTEVSAPLAAVLAQAHPPVARTLQRFGAVEVVFEDERAFYNVNRVADLDAAEGMGR